MQYITGNTFVERFVRSKSDPREVNRSTRSSTPEVPRRQRLEWEHRGNLLRTKGLVNRNEYGSTGEVAEPAFLSPDDVSQEMDKDGAYDPSQPRQGNVTQVSVMSVGCSAQSSTCLGRTRGVMFGQRALVVSTTQYLLSAGGFHIKGFPHYSITNVIDHLQSPLSIELRGDGERSEARN